MTNARRYYRPDRKETVEVGLGLGRHPYWIVGVRNARGSLRRIKSPRLPPVPDREACQANLDQYASEKGWIEQSPVWSRRRRRVSRMSTDH